MKRCAGYLAQAKIALGDALMTDSELGERLGGYIQQGVSIARSGFMSDPMAISVAKAIGIPPGEVLLVSRAEREKNADIRGFLCEWVEHSLAHLVQVQVAPDVVMRDGVKKVRLSKGSARWRHGRQHGILPPLSVKLAA